ncbi:D-alanine--D-alanine ligase family protein [Pokkaliibacter sp. CJK22405]|uniref:D-alanine--D-alanine ligase family protein n=1 Tax=Pokkaliibacter sp. CJK22405 TaxID=3384615 RepID=UPI003984A63F
MTMNVVVLFGGRSAEHEVSQRSAANVIAALDRQRFHIMPVYIDFSGNWYRLEDNDDISQPVVTDQLDEVLLSRQGLINFETHAIENVDVIFPVLHGPYGEDGAIQGLCKVMDLPCVGSDILGSAIGMDKDIAKRLLNDAGIPVAEYVMVRAGHSELDLQALEAKLGYPMFVKPANMGSSVGVSKVESWQALQPAIEEALRFDAKVLIEAAIDGREIECAVLGNLNLESSTVGEVATSDHFYSYSKKYLNEAGTDLMIPAALDEDTIQRARAMAEKTYAVLEARGLARVDMFVTPQGDLYVNEINTLPGFTSISMYPKLWEASGLQVTELLSRLIDLAREHYRSQHTLQVRYLNA